MKKKYKVLQNIKYYLGEIHDYKPFIFIHVIVYTITTVAIALMNVLVPTLIVAMLASQVRLGDFLLHLLLMALGLSLFTVIHYLITQISFIDYVGVRIESLAKKTYCKFLDLDYESITKAEYNYVFMQAKQNALSSNSNGGEAMGANLTKLFINVVGLITYGVITAYLTPLLFTLVVLAGAASYLALGIIRSFREKNRSEWNRLDTQIRYLRNRSLEIENGKDVRVYQLQDWLATKMDTLNDQRLMWFKRESSKKMQADLISAIALFIRDGFAYSALGTAVINGISVTQFTLFFSVMNGFNQWTNEIIDALHHIMIASQDINDLRSWIELPDDDQDKPQITMNPGPIAIEFRQVCYRYSSAAKDCLHDLSFTIDGGEKIALVGINGAGKSTIVKLMCGLLRPSSGQILINGIDSLQFSRQQLFELFSPVFQESEIWAMSVEQNVSMRKHDDTDSHRVWSDLEQSGLKEKVDTLEKKLNTPLTRNLYQDGVEFSGGEAQKLMLARALYKDGKVLLLDEPTAALDAIAENEMYLHYDQLAQNKTAIFISHRLSSTRFCDRIFFLENGQILENGSHQDLMAHGGAYADMFAIQSHYYQKEVEA